MRVLGLDMGDKRIGIAMCDPEGILASPFDVIDADREAKVIKTIVDIARENNVELIVIGQPRSLDGTLGPQAQKAQAFSDALAQGSGLPVKLWDERFSSVMADRLMREAGTKRAKMKQRRDAVAAAIILQSYLDSQRARGGED